MDKDFFKNALKFFLRGLIYTIPLAVTLYVIYNLFTYFDGLIPVNIPGLGLIIVFILITIIGVLGSSYIAVPVRDYFTKLLDRAPLIKTLYTSIGDLLSAFVGEKKRFNKPVLVKISADGGVEKLGFITEEDLSELGIAGDKIAVYLPHSYNFSGNLFIVSRDRVTPIDRNASEVMKFIVSGGVSKVEDESSD